MVTKGNIHNMMNWPQSVSTSSCAIRKGLKYIECHTQCIYCTRMATTWRSDCLTEVKVIKSNSVGPRKRLRGADEGRLNSGPLNAGLTLIAFTRQLTWSCKSPLLVHVTYGCYSCELTHKPPCYLSYHVSWLCRYAEQNMRDCQEELQSKTEELRSVLESSTIAENELREEAKLRKRYYLPMTLTKKNMSLSWYLWATICSEMSFILNS